jgi:hypothetical protein
VDEFDVTRVHDSVGVPVVLNAEIVMAGETGNVSELFAVTPGARVVVRTVGTEFVGDCETTGVTAIVAITVPVSFNTGTGVVAGSDVGITDIVGLVEFAGNSVRFTDCVEFSEIVIVGTIVISERIC